MPRHWHAHHDRPTAWATGHWLEGGSPTAYTLVGATGTYVISGTAATLASSFVPTGSYVIIGYPAELIWSGAGREPLVIVFSDQHFRVPEFSEETFLSS